MSVTMMKRARVNIPIKDVESIYWSRARGEVLKQLRYKRPREECVKRVSELTPDDSISLGLLIKLERGDAKTVPIKTLRKVALGLGTPLYEVSLDRLLREVLAVD